MATPLAPALTVSHPVPHPAGPRGRGLPSPTPPRPTLVHVCVRTVAHE